MKKIFKRIILILSILIILPVIVAVIAITCYKQDLSQMLIDKLESDYGVSVKVGHVSVGILEGWPDATVKLEHVTIRSLQPGADTTAMFRAGKIGLSLNLPKLISKKFQINSVSVENAFITLVKDSADVCNFKLKSVRDTSASKSGIQFDIKKVILKQVSFRFLNHERKQDIHFLCKHNTIKLKHYADGIKANLQGSVLFHQFLFKPEKGPFLQNTPADLKLDVSVFSTHKIIFVAPSSGMTISGQAFQLSAYANLNEPRLLVLNVKANDLNYKKSLPLLNYNIRHSLRQINLSNTLDVDAMLVIALGKKQDPQMIIHVKGHNNDVEIGNSKVPYKHVRFDGSIINIAFPGKEPDMQNACIVFHHIRGEVYQFPFTANLKIRNLRKPDIDVHASMQIDASKIDFKPGQEFVLSGNCIAGISYQGPVYGLNRESFLNDPMKLYATVQFNNLSYREKQNAFLYTVNGNAIVTNKDLKFSKLAVQTAGGKLLIDGFAQGFTSYIFGNSNGFKTSVSATAGSFDLNPFISKDDKVTKKTNTAKLNEASQSKFQFDIKLKAKQLTARKIIATNVDAELQYANELLNVSKLNMNACKGSLAIKGNLEKLTDLNATVTASEVDIRTLMEQFENFGQNTVVSTNVLGTVNIHASFQSKLDNSMKIVPTSMIAQVYLTLKDGHLLEYEPLQNVSNYIFRKRNFNDITFSQLEQTFDVHGYEMKIDHLEIASNVLNLYVDGIYNFKGESNINLKIPWNNLKKRGENYVPRNMGKAGEDVKSLKLNYHGFPGKLKLSLGNR
ncbi:MAG: AsmA family protein [Bacteroidetes bacterium]|nr:AsmA family protein [Bacteroidota bacterium]